MVGTLLPTLRRCAMYQSQFLAAALRNLANEIIAEQLFELSLPDA